MHVRLHLRLQLRLTTMICSKHGLLQTDRNLWKRMLKTGCHFCLCSKLSAKAGKIHVVTWHRLTVLANSGSSGLEGECQKSMWTSKLTPGNGKFCVRKTFLKDVFIMRYRHKLT